MAKPNIESLGPEKEEKEDNRSAKKARKDDSKDEKKQKKKRERPIFYYSSPEKMAEDWTKNNSPYLDKFKELMKRGFCVIENVLDATEVKKCLDDLNEMEKLWPYPWVEEKKEEEQDDG